MAAAAGVLGDGEQRWDVVARVGVLGRQERVVEIELAHGDAVGPRSPFGLDMHPRRAAEDRRSPRPDGPDRPDCRVPAGRESVAQGLGAGVGDRATPEGGGSDAGVVDEPVDHHLGNLGLHWHGVGCHHGQLPGQLLLAW